MELRHPLTVVKSLAGRESGAVSTGLRQLTHSLNRRGLRATLRDAQAIGFRPLAPANSPRHLQVEIITRCNLACTMCPRTAALQRAATPDERARWLQMMPFDRYRAILDQFPRLQTLALHGLGEPLLHPHLFEMVAEAAARNIAPRFTSNLTLLSPERADRLLAAGLSRLIVSLDGATAATYEAIRVRASFALVVANLSYLLQARRRLGTARPVVHVNMVVSTPNRHEVPAMVQLCGRLGVDGLILSPIEPATKEMEPLTCSPTDWEQLAQTAREAARQVGLPVFIRGGARRGRRAATPSGGQATHKCLQPWLVAVVTGEGLVMPCCNIHSPEFAMGNVMTQAFERIWQGGRYQSFRQELKQPGHVPAPCAWCPDF